MKDVITTEQGFLINWLDWTEEIACDFASQQGLTLGPLHWSVIYFVRDFFAHYQYSPIQRFIVKHLKTLDPQLASIDLVQLFPQGPRQICLIAGLKKPERCV